MAIQDGLALNEAIEYTEGDIKLALKVFNDNRYKEVREFQLLEKVGILLETVFLSSDDNRSTVQRALNIKGSRSYYPFSLTSTFVFMLWETDTFHG